MQRKTKVFIIYCEADLCLCFHIGKHLVFPLHDSYNVLSFAGVHGEAGVKRMKVF